MQRGTRIIAKMNETKHQTRPKDIDIKVKLDLDKEVKNIANTVKETEAFLDNDVDSKEDSQTTYCYRILNTVAPYLTLFSTVSFKSIVLSDRKKIIQFIIFFNDKCNTTNRRYSIVTIT